jgi:hypothetical protein
MKQRRAKALSRICPVIDMNEHVVAARLACSYLTHHASGFLTRQKTRAE